MKILVFEKELIHPEAVELLKNNGMTIYYENDTYDPSEIGAVFIRTYTQIDPQFLDKFSNVKFILRAGVGLDNIDAEECKKRNIQIFNSPGSNANAVAEFVIGLIIMLLRKIPTQMRQIQVGQWRDKDFEGEELKDKIVGIVGCGAIGRLIAQKLQSWETKELLGFDPFLTQDLLSQNRIKKVDLDILLKEADIVTLHLPLLPETKHIINKEKIQLMKNGAYLINTSRGGIIDENDLIEAVKNKKLKGAALDVFEEEPGINNELKEFENIILSPHIGAFTENADKMMSIQTVQNFLQNYTGNR